MRVLELFAGYGSQALALENLGIDFVSDISEIDKYAIQAYNQLHGDTHNWGDICKIDETKLPYYDLITYSSPCQDFSAAGLGQGGDKGSGTRSSLLWECERIIRAVKPKYLLMENVRNLVGQRHKHNFIRWLKVLESLGYQNFWQILNAKDYGAPQNRERVFVVSILGGGQYLFPNPIKLQKRLKDVLESNVNEKYYLNIDNFSDFAIDANREYSNAIRCGGGSSTDKKHTWDIIKEPSVLTPKRNEYGKAIRKDYESGAVKESIHSMRDLEPRDDGVSNTLTSFLKDNLLAEPLALDEQNGYIREDGLCGTLTTDGNSPKHNNRVVEPIRIPEPVKKGYTEAYEGDCINLDFVKSPSSRGKVGKQISNTLMGSCNMGVVEPAVQQIGNIVQTESFGGNPERGRVYSDSGLSPCLSTMEGGGREPKIVKDYRIRKLTPRECWRLMGVKDEQFNKLHDISNTQLYKLAGNSIVVDVLMGIFKNLLQTDTDTKGQLTLL